MAQNKIIEKIESQQNNLLITQNNLNSLSTTRLEDLKEIYTYIDGSQIPIKSDLDQLRDEFNIKNHNFEYGTYNAGTLNYSNTKTFQISFQNNHSQPPKTILVGYGLYNYFRINIHVDNNYVPTNKDFRVAINPEDIGNGHSGTQIYWIAIW